MLLVTHVWFMEWINSICSMCQLHVEDTTILARTLSHLTRLKNYSKNWNFSKFSNDLKNVSRHCGGHYNMKTKHFEDISGGGSKPPPTSNRVNSNISFHTLNNNWLIINIYFARNIFLAFPLTACEAMSYMRLFSETNL